LVKLALYHFSVRLQVLTFFFLDSKKHFSYAFSHKSKFETVYRFEDERGQVHYGLNERVVQDGVAIGHPVLLKGDLYQGLEPTGEKAKVLRLLAPVVPTNILCIGRNYVGHIKELGNVVPEYPILFIKNNGSINHPGAPIRLPKCF
jgi:2-keto-4-pentenoate hydratase/2-oxohepta-3-ene-1,7-dioic acid hydratase in catechol pathway